VEINNVRRIKLGNKIVNLYKQRDGFSFLSFCLLFSTTLWRLS